MKPLLAHIFEPKRLPPGEPFFVQPKFDGIRALYQAGHFQSRDELPMAPGLLKHLTDPLKEMFPDERVILDGELYVHGWPLGRINGAVTPVRQEPNEDTLQVGYWVFDRVMYDYSFEDRFKSIESTIRNLGEPKNIHIATTVRYTDIRESDTFYTLCVSEGFEGIMYRLGRCPYTTPKQHSGVGKRFLSDKNNRTWHLLKRKDWQDNEFECVAVEEGIGKRRGKVGAFVCTNDTLKNRVFRVGSGISDSEAEHYFVNQPVGRKIKVKYRCLTFDGIPFNPTVIAVL